MEKDRVVSILRALAAGHDPHSGTPLAAGAYQHVDTVRALYAALDLIEGRYTGPIDAATVMAPLLSATAAAAPAAPATPTAKPARPRAAGRTGNSGKPWSTEEDERLLAAFDAGRPPQDIALAHGRSRIAIEARLARFERMPMPAGVRQRTAATPASAGTDAGVASSVPATPIADAPHHVQQSRRRYVVDTHH